MNAEISMPDAMIASADDLDLSVVLPCHNEEPCLESVISEIDTVLSTLNVTSEIVVVNDASEDGTLSVLRELVPFFPRLRHASHRVRCGQSAALVTAIHLARGASIVTLDGDGQNDPGDIPRLLEALRHADLVCGVRLERQDTWVRRASSRIGNAFRNAVTGDHIRDSGCAMRAARREMLSEVPVFDGLHRFLPTLMRLQGARVIEIGVNHRARVGGTSKYGVRNRLFRGIADCLAILWWRRRAVLVDRISLWEPTVPALAPSDGSKLAS